MKVAMVMYTKIGNCSTVNQAQVHPKAWEPSACRQSWSAQGKLELEGFSSPLLSVGAGAPITGILALSYLLLQQRTGQNSTWKSYTPKRISPQFATIYESLGYLVTWASCVKTQSYCV